MSKNIKIAANATKAKLLEPDFEAKEIVQEALSYYVFGYENTRSFKNDKWDGRSSMFDWHTNTFPAGFISLVGAHLKQKGYRPTLVRKPLPTPLGELPKTLGGFSYTEKYDYQWEVVKKLEEHGSMIARLATGAGKTFAAALCYKRINRPTLILTKRAPLLNQFVERLGTFGIDAGIVGDSNLEFNNNITVAMSQTLNNKLDDSEVQAYLKKVEFIIGEEAHEISDDSYANVVNACPNAYYKLALTATPFMKDESEANMKLMGAFGAVRINVTEKMLIDRGVNATPIIKYVDYDAPSSCKFNSNYRKAVDFGLVRAETRNDKIVKYTAQAKKRSLPTLILIGRQDHGKLLVEELKKAGIKSKFIFGETSRLKRKQALDELASGEVDALIGSTILDVGVDVPGIGLLILAGGGKAEVGYRQRIGRGLRSKPSGPNVCFVVDFNDHHNLHLFEHWQERHKIVKGTPGFAENVLGGNEDLPFHLFDKV